MDHTKNVRRGNVRRSAENLRCASAATPNGLRGLAEAAVLTISLVREEFPRASSLSSRRRTAVDRSRARTTRARHTHAKTQPARSRTRLGFDATRLDRIEERTLGL